MSITTTALSKELAWHLLDVLLADAIKWRDICREETPADEIHESLDQVNRHCQVIAELGLQNEPELGSWTYDQIDRIADRLAERIEEVEQ